MAADADRLSAEDTFSSPSDEKRTMASHLERAWILNVIIVAAGIGVLALNWSKTGPTLDINSVIFLFLLAGLCLHRGPQNYFHSLNQGSRVTRSIVLADTPHSGLLGGHDNHTLSGGIFEAFVYAV